MGSKWTFSQSSGHWRDYDGDVVALCYSGRGPGLFNPDYQGVAGMGPIPRGLYRLTYLVGPNHYGQGSMRLVPQPGTNTFGRDGFLIHWDNAGGDFSASEGCVVSLSPRLFGLIHDGDILEVVK